MKAKRFLPAAGIAILLAASLVSACGQKDAAAALDCPFSEMDWDSSTEDVFSAEGEEYSTYDSVYGGTTYSYPKEYSGKEGTIKYMFNENDQLMCIAWAYGSEDADELYALYDELHASVNDIYGDSGYNTDKSTNYGDVWYLEEGDIVLSTMITSSNKALQYSYLNPAVSNTVSDTEAAAE